MTCVLLVVNALRIATASSSNMLIHRISSGLLHVLHPSPPQDLLFLVLLVGVLLHVRGLRLLCVFGAGGRGFLSSYFVDCVLLPSLVFRGCSAEVPLVFDRYLLAGHAACSGVEAYASSLFRLFFAFCGRFL
jgi:hypothetical protein